MRKMSDYYEGKMREFQKMLDRVSDGIERISDKLDTHNQHGEHVFIQVLVSKSEVDIIEQQLSEIKLNIAVQVFDFKPGKTLKKC